MKKFLMLATVVATLVACKNTPHNDAQDIDEELSEIVESNEYKEHDLMKLRATEDIVDTEGGNSIVLTIEPDESLPHVANDNFGTYCDNRATVVALSQDGDTLLSRHLTKADMQEYIDAPLLSSAILDGLSLESATPSAIVVNASISVPHSDEQAVVALTMGFDGTLTMQRVSAPVDNFFDDEFTD